MARCETLGLRQEIAIVRTLDLPESTNAGSPGKVDTREGCSIVEYLVEVV